MGTEHNDNQCLRHADANSERDNDPRSDAHYPPTVADGNRNSRFNAGDYAYAQLNSDTHSHTYSHGNSLSDPYSHANTDSHLNAECESNSGADLDSKPNGNPDAHNPSH
jgi:hypothetical protein